jgi:hypothetical protein
VRPLRSTLMRIAVSRPHKILEISKLSPVFPEAGMDQADRERAVRRQIVTYQEAAATENAPEFKQLDEGTQKFLASTAKSDTASVDDYKDKLLKHIPAEAVATYVTLDGIIRSSTQGDSLKVWLWVAFAVGLVGTPLYLWRLQGVNAPLQLSVSAASFILWVFAVGGAFSLYSWYHSWFASVALVGFTFLVPVVLGQGNESISSAT